MTALPERRRESRSRRSTLLHWSATRGALAHGGGLRPLQFRETNEGCDEVDVGGHNHEPGCAIQRALGEGTLDAVRFEKYRAVWLKLSAAVSFVRVAATANPDDLTTQPTGNAGGRIGCGLVMKG